MLTTASVVGVCLASAAFCIRFLMALRAESQRALICHVACLDSEAAHSAPPKQSGSLRARAQAA